MSPLISVEDLPAQLADRPNAARFLSCWSGWRNGRGFPVHGDIPVADVDTIMSDMYVVNVEDLQSPSIVIAGVLVEARFGVGIMNAGLLEFTRSKEERIRNSRFSNMMKTPCGNLTLTWVKPPDHEAIAFSLLPIGKDDQDRPTTVYGAFDLVDPEALAPVDPRLTPMIDAHTYVDIGFGVPNL